MNFRGVAAAFIVLTVIFGASTAYLLAGFRGGPQTTTATVSATSTLTTTVTTAGGSGFAVNLAYKQGIGFYLVNGSGWTLYYRTADNITTGQYCSGSCLSVWPAFYAPSVNAPPGLNASSFGTVTRPDGTKQTTYDDRPLYRYAGDSAPGQTNGEGIQGIWFAYALPAGSETTTTASTLASTSSYTLGGGSFNTPGNILISDQFNNRVIEVDPLTDQIVWSFGSGNGSLCNPGPGSVIGPNDAERLAGGLTLIAGTGIPSGVPAPACADNRVIIVNQQGDIVWQYGRAGVNGSGPGLLNVPVFAIQAPNKDILIVDQGNNRVIEVNYTTMQIDWSYGPTSGPGQLNSPNAVQLLSDGNVLIADQGNNRVIEVDPHTEQIVWQYNQGLNTAADASRLPNNDTLIVDSGNSRVVEVSQEGSIVWEYFTNSSQGSNPSPDPSNAARLANGDTIISDQVNDRIIIVNVAGQIVYQYGMINVPGDGPNQLNWPYSAYVIGDYTGQTVPPGLG